MGNSSMMKSSPYGRNIMKTIEEKTFDLMIEMSKKFDSMAREMLEVKALFKSDFVSIEEAAGMRGISTVAIRKKINNGHIDPLNDVRHHGRKLYIRRSTVETMFVKGGK